MRFGVLISSLHPIALFVVVVVVCELVAEVGAWLARKKIRDGITESEGPIGTVVGAILGLLALLLGFTFSLTESRFGDRKNLVIEQANAINTCYLRSALLPDQHQAGIRKSLHAYITVLLQINSSTISEYQQEDEQLSVRLQNLHSQMWSQAVALRNEEMDGEIRTFFIGSLNDVINIYTERETVALIFRIPDVIWTSLLLLTVLGTFVAGYQTSNSSTRRMICVPLLAGSFALVFIMIADMDSLKSDRFHVSQKPLQNVLKLIEKENQ
jgi:hypothetical protein